jgi:two-component system response regulator FixJ
MIVHIGIPEMSRLNLIRKLREQDIMTPVFVITALPLRQLDNEAISSSVHGFLENPFETKALLDCVERSLSYERLAQ